jgi:hypothetical protein
MIIVHWNPSGFCAHFPDCGIVWKLDSPAAVCLQDTPSSWYTPSLRGMLCADTAFLLVKGWMVKGPSVFKTSVFTCEVIYKLQLYMFSCSDVGNLQWVSPNSYATDMADQDLTVSSCFFVVGDVGAQHRLWGSVWMRMKEVISLRH